MHNVDTLNICMKTFDAIKLLFDKMIAFLYNLLLYKGFVRAQIVHARGNQLTPELYGDLVYKSTFTEAIRYYADAI